MPRKIAGFVLLAVGGFVALVLLMSGRPLIPHMIGPIALIVVGGVLLGFKRKPPEPRPG